MPLPRDESEVANSFPGFEFLQFVTLAGFSIESISLKFVPIILKIVFGLKKIHK